jgi:prevent-host-death family protein
VRRVIPHQLTQRELRNRSGEIMRALDHGERFVVTRRGVPVADLTPVNRRGPVNADELLHALAAGPRIDQTRLRADLDAIVDQDPAPRA